MGENLQIAVARIHRLNSNSPVKAFADIKINESLLIKGLRVVQSAKGLFVSMPQEKSKDSKWYDTILPLSKEVRAEIVSKVLNSYNEKEE